MEKPILFNTDMVRAILDGRKTETRRPIKPHLPNRIIKYVCYGRPPGFLESNWILNYENDIVNYFGHIKPPFQVGDILYIRETWCRHTDMHNNSFECAITPGFYYKVDALKSWVNNKEIVKWRPSIHMPKEAARIFLKVTEVRAEQLHDITDEGCKVEGVRPSIDGDAKDWLENENGWHRTFRQLWDGVYKNWSENPWVWVIKFKKYESLPTSEHQELISL